MIKQLLTFLEADTDLIGLVDNISYKKPIREYNNYFYFTYNLSKEQSYNDYRIQFTIIWESIKKIEDISDRIECLLNSTWRWNISIELREAIPKIWKTLLVSKTNFDDENIIVLDFQIYYNF